MMTHGHTAGGQASPEYRSRHAMIDRCTNVRHPHFHNYGGRGIRVCDRWLLGDGEKTGVECFAEDMGPRPPGHSIDRIDGNGNYEPGNCRWASRSTQMRNRKPFKLTLIQANEIRTLEGCLHPREIAARYGVSETTIRDIFKGRTWCRDED